MIEVTPSDIIQYRYCPRFIYFERVLQIPQFEERRHKVMAGRHLHDERLARNKGYLRKRLGVVDKKEDIYLSSGWLRGRVDEVLWLGDGTAAPLDYKFAEWRGRVRATYVAQVQCYALLIEEAFAVKVTRGYVVYTRSNSRVEEVGVDEAGRAAVRREASAIGEITAEGYFPRATRVRSRCAECTYRNICPQ